jgi:hypothetical protein
MKRTTSDFTTTSTTTKTTSVITRGQPRKGDNNPERGVSFYPRTQQWTARVTTAANTRKHLGYFATKEEAVAALADFKRQALKIGIPQLCDPHEYEEPYEPANWRKAEWQVVNKDPEASSKDDTMEVTTILTQLKDIQNTIQEGLHKNGHVWQESEEDEEEAFDCDLEIEAPQKYRNDETLYFPNLSSALSGVQPFNQ